MGESPERLNYNVELSRIGSTIFPIPPFRRRLRGLRSSVLSILKVRASKIVVQASCLLWAGKMPAPQ